MSDLLKSGIAVLSQLLKSYASQQVTYARGYDSVDLAASYGKKLLRLDDGFGGIRLEWTDLDFIITAADLVLSGQAITPERGDLIYVVINEQVQTFEVLPYGSEPAWRWSDPYQTMFRIHTKCIEVEPYF